MKRLLLAALGALSVAGLFKGPPPGRYPVQPPPKRYASGEFPIKPAYVIVADANETCQKLAPLPNGERYQACSLPTLGIIYLPPDDGSQWWVKLKQHEEAHIRGWRHD